jgi:hypothetical protein
MHLFLNPKRSVMTVSPGKIWRSINSCKQYFAVTLWYADPYRFCWSRRR